MTAPSIDPRILIVTPEVTCLPPGMGDLSSYVSVKVGEVADI
jgi:starch synthase/alpha-amylase